MANSQPCTQSLFLLGEMVNAALHCASLCDERVKHEDIVLVQQAYEQIDSLKHLSQVLVGRILELEMRLHAKLQEQKPRSLDARPE
jgi:hypothetical protein